VARDRLDTDALYAALDAQRTARKLSWRQLAKEVGVSPSTMTRLANGQRPDVDSFAGLVRWLGQSADTFLVSDDQAPREEPDLVAQLAPLLRARRDLSDDDAKYLEDLIGVAARRFKAERAELSVRRGFKSEAQKLALELRAELGLDAYAKFDPYALAAEYGIPVFLLSDLGQDPEAGKAAAHYASNGSATFSAALVPVGSTRLILDNDAHDPRRRRNSVSHEMSHLVLEHEFGQVLLTGEGYRAFSPDKEEEANWLGGELLIPYAAAERAARHGWDDEQVAQEFDVSIQLARMRMNYSGARKIVARKRAYGSQNFR
jgi:transcriptional regulator with XRE-family HTH domain